jgi:hypothetical protein
MKRATALALEPPAAPQPRISGAVLSVVPRAVADVGAATRARIAELIERHNNPNTLIADAAVEAALAGRPAFWKRTGYSNAVVGLICVNVNMGMPLAEALERWAQPRSVHGTTVAILAELIPLNAAADAALSLFRKSLT